MITHLIGLTAYLLIVVILGTLMGQYLKDWIDRYSINKRFDKIEMEKERIDELAKRRRNRDGA